MSLDQNLTLMPTIFSGLITKNIEFLNILLIFFRLYDSERTQNVHLQRNRVRLIMLSIK